MLAVNLPFSSNVFKSLKNGFPLNGLVGVPASSLYTVRSLPRPPQHKYCGSLTIKITKNPSSAKPVPDDCCPTDCNDDCDGLTWMLSSGDGCCGCASEISQKLCLPTGKAPKDLKDAIAESFRFAMNLSSYFRWGQVQLKDSTASSASYTIPFSSQSKIVASVATSECCQGNFLVEASLQFSNLRSTHGCFNPGIGIFSDFCNGCNIYYGVPTGSPSEQFVGIAALKAQLSPGCCAGDDCQIVLLGEVVIPLECAPLKCKGTGEYKLYYRVSSPGLSLEPGSWKLIQKGAETTDGLVELPSYLYRIISFKGNRAIVNFVY